MSCVFGADVKSDRRPSAHQEKAPPSRVRGRVVNHRVDSKVGKLSRPPVLDALCPHGFPWHSHAPGDDNALAVFGLDPLQLRLLHLVAGLALCGLGSRSWCGCRQPVQRTRLRCSPGCALRGRWRHVGPVGISCYW